ncbi:MAG: PAS domain-containing protein [Caulobacteraceae bacterium]
MAEAARVDEAERLEELARYAILDTGPEAAFDDIVKVVAALCHTPIAAVTLVDDARQWFKAEVGLGVSGTSRSDSFCTHAIEQGGLYVVPDAAEHPLFRDNALVVGPPYIRFYAGAVLETERGFRLGSLCVIDTEPRPQGLTRDQSVALRAMGRQVVALFELRRSLKAEQAATAKFRSIASALDLEEGRRKSSQERLELAMRAGVIGAWDWDVAHDRVRADASFAKTFGVSAEQAAEGVPLHVFMAGIHPDDRDYISDSIRSATEDFRDFSEEYRVIPNGRTRWVLARGRCYADAEGRPVRFPGVAIDITERKMAEEALNEASAGRELAMQAAQLGRWDHNPSEGRYFWDARQCEMLGLAPDTSPSVAKLLSLLHPDDQARVADGIARATNPQRVGGYAEEYRVILPDTGEVRWMSAFGRSAFENNKCIRFVGVLQDVTDRKRAEALSLETQLRTRLAIEAGSIGVWEFEPATGALTWDDRVRAMFGLEPGAPIDFETNIAGIHPDDRARAVAAVETALDPAGAGAYEIEFRTLGVTDGVVRWVAANGQAVREGGEAVRLLGTLRDITEQKSAEAHQHLLTNELNHRVKNTLATVQALVSQTLRTATSPEEARRAVDERLVVLGRAHDILTRTSWTAAPIFEVVAGATTPLTVGGGRVRAHGPARQLAPKPALSLALALHELGVNAVKYGALSNDTGHVEISWSIEPGAAGRRFHLQWSEHGGPAVAPPTRRGFGSKLIQSALAAEFHGEVQLDFRPSGVVWTVDAPLDVMEEEAA